MKICIRTTNTKEASAFYYGILKTLSQADSRPTTCNWCEQNLAVPTEPIMFERARGQLPNNLIASVTFKTSDAEGLRKFLLKNKVEVGKLNKWPSGAAFSVLDPESHLLIFVQSAGMGQLALGMPGAYAASSPAWPHIIHAGFVVRDRTAMDHFYKDILGFRLYWLGGMKDGETDWVDMQLPDGTDWIEFMLNVPPDADQRTLGVMNHVALGVVDMRRADELLLDSSLHLPINEQPQIGRDGKWQLNLYDPDGTRVELMEFTPVEKPCCSEYTGPHPKQ
jgi:catechol 2,3-dioxygenase-like lactoylglutathione lyase family enzyme